MECTTLKIQTVNKYLDLLSSFIDAAISHRTSLGFNWAPLGIDVIANSLELRWTVHYKHKALRFTSDVGPDEGDYIFSKIINHISLVDSMELGG